MKHIVIPHWIGAYAWWTACFVAAIYVSLLLGGCAVQLHSVEGESVEPPFGFVIYCATHPERVECGGDK